MKSTDNFAPANHDGPNSTSNTPPDAPAITAKRHTNTAAPTTWSDIASKKHPNPQHVPYSEGRGASSKRRYRKRTSRRRLLTSNTLSLPLSLSLSSLSLPLIPITDTYRQNNKREQTLSTLQKIHRKHRSILLPTATCQYPNLNTERNNNVNTITLIDTTIDEINKLSTKFDNIAERIEHNFSTDDDNDIDLTTSKHYHELFLPIEATILHALDDFNTYLNNIDTSENNKQYNENEGSIKHYPDDDEYSTITNDEPNTDKLTLLYNNTTNENIIIQMETYHTTTSHPTIPKRITNLTILPPWNIQPPDNTTIATENDLPILPPRLPQPSRPTERPPSLWIYNTAPNGIERLPILPPHTHTPNESSEPTAQTPMNKPNAHKPQIGGNFNPTSVPILPPRLPTPPRPDTPPPTTWNANNNYYHSSDNYQHDYLFSDSQYDHNEHNETNITNVSHRPRYTDNNTATKATDTTNASVRNDNGNGIQNTSLHKRQHKRNKFDDNLVFITQNARGLPIEDDTKLRSLIHQMQTNKWSAICIQETWRLGSEDFYINGHRVLMRGHSVKENDKGHTKAGVCIIINETLDAAYKQAGSKQLTLPHNHIHEGRFLGIHLHFKRRDNYGKRLKGYTKVALCSIYHPIKPTEHNEFGNDIHTLLNSLPADTALLFGHDINCNVGTNKTLPDAIKHTLGPFGLENRNPKGMNFLQQLCALNMRVANSYFMKPNYATWKNFNPNHSHYHMLDVFSISTLLFKHVIDCGTCKHGIDHTDHTATSITINIGSIMKKQTESNNVHGGRTDWNRILQDPDTKSDFNTKLSSEYDIKASQGEDYTTFNETVLETAKSTAITTSKPTVDWFEMSKDKIQPLIDRVTKLRAIQRTPSDANPSRTTRELKLCIRLKTIAIREAKSKYMSYIAEKIGTLSGDNTKAMWDAIKTCKLGHEVNYQRPTSMALTLPCGRKANNDKENMSVLQPHCEKLFNNIKPVSLTALDNIDQRNIETSLDDPITWKEFTRALNGLKNNKSPGANEVPAEAFKAMNNKNRSIIFNFINDFWNDESDFDEWHTGQGIPVPKTTHASNPNQFRIVNLMDVGSKIFSRILTARLYNLLEQHGTKYQFGATPNSGCQDGNFTLKTFLHLRRQHNLETYVVFADLVKAFDTSNHILISQILERFGTPPKLTSAIRRLYSDLRVTLKVGKESVDIQQTVGVRQGDNLSPVIFLFVMTAFAETLEKKWTQAGLPRIEAEYTPISPSSKAQLTGHIRPTHSAGSTTSLSQVLFLDDSGFPFNTRDDAITGTRIIKETFTELGLEMHCGSKENKTSKTEILWVPAPSFYSYANDQQTTPIALSTSTCDTQPPDTPTDIMCLTQLASIHEHTNDPSRNGTTNNDEQTLNQRKRPPRKLTFHTMLQAQREQLYWNSPNTKRIELDDTGSFIDFTAHFKYLGSYISFDLTDDIDIANRITKASQAMAALHHFWRNPYADLRAKKLIFLAIPANLLLWGCETWALRQTHIDQLNVFWHRSIRNILGIRMQDVIDDHISNEQIRKIFHDIPDAFATLTARSMNYLGKIVRAPDSHPPKLLVTAWIRHPRPKSGVLMTNKKALVRGINTLLPNETTEEITITCKITGETTTTKRHNPNGKLSNWINIALDKRAWEWHIHKLTHPNSPVPPYPQHDERNRQHNRHQENEQDSYTPPPRHRNTNNNRREDRRNHENERRQNTPPDPSRNHERQDYNVDDVGRNKTDSLKALGLNPRATPTEIKHRFRQLSLIYHPDKYSDALEISKEQATAHFQLINNAYDFLRRN